MSTSLYRVITVLLIGQLASCLDVSISSAPSTEVPVSRSLISFSIEQDRWTDWVGTTSRNQFFFNTLDNLRQLTGEPPQIRIGGNSEDHTNFDQNVQFSQAIFPPPTAASPYPEGTNITVGDAYYKTAQYLPPNTHVIWGLNLGQNNLTAAFLEAKSLVEAFASPAVKDAGVTLDAIEIGNEANRYKINGARPTTYTPAQYVKEWINFATNVTAVARLTPSSSTKFWGAAFSNTSQATSDFSPQVLFDEGILSSPPGGLISTISQHRYSGSFCSEKKPTLQDLMTKSTIRGDLTLFKPDIDATHARGLKYVLGETNSYSCHGIPGVSNTAGAALWALDYILFATQLGISRVFFHEGIGFKYNLIQPVTLDRSITDGTPLSSPLPPHVQPQYYGAIIAAEAIGSSGNTCVVELNIDDDRISGYAFYEHGHLVRALIINLRAFLGADSASRTSVHINLAKLSENVPAVMTVKRLNIPRADATSGLTWGGQHYDTTDGRVSPGVPKVELVNVSNGVDIQETEAVLLSFT